MSPLTKTPTHFFHLTQTPSIRRNMLDIEPIQHLLDVNLKNVNGSPPNLLDSDSHSIVVDNFENLDPESLFADIMSVSDISNFIDGLTTPQNPDVSTNNNHQDHSYQLHSLLSQSRRLRRRRTPPSQPKKRMSRQPFHLQQTTINNLIIPPHQLRTSSQHQNQHLSVQPQILQHFTQQRRRRRLTSNQTLHVN